jgi:hypothetical protein
MPAAYGAMDRCIFPVFKDYSVQNMVTRLHAQSKAGQEPF